MHTSNSFSAPSSYAELMQVFASEGLDVAHINEVIRSTEEPFEPEGTGIQLSRECSRCGDSFEMSEELCLSLDENHPLNICPRCDEQFRRSVVAGCLDEVYRHFGVS